MDDVVQALSHLCGTSDHAEPPSKVHDEFRQLLKTKYGSDDAQLDAAARSTTAARQVAQALRAVNSDDYFRLSALAREIVREASSTEANSSPNGVEISDVYASNVRIKDIEAPGLAVRVIQTRVDHDLEIENVTAIASLGADNDRVSLTNTTIGGDFVYTTVYRTEAPFYGVPKLPTTILERTIAHSACSEGLRKRGLVLLPGLAGVGKTTLAIQLAYDEEVRKHYADGIIWISVGPAPDLEEILSSYADALGLARMSEVSKAQRKRAVQNAIGQQSMLLIFDDVWNAELFNQIDCGGPSCGRIVTTRDLSVANRIDSAPSNKVPIDPLSGPAALALLQSIAPQACNVDLNLAKRIIVAVGGLPLAITLIGAYLSANTNEIFPELSRQALADLDNSEARLALVGRRLGTDFVDGLSLYDIITLSLNDLDGMWQESAENLPVKEAFMRLASFAPQPAEFSRDAAMAVCGIDLRCLAHFVSRNIIQVGPLDRLTLHRSVWDAAQQSSQTVGRLRHFDFYTHYAAGHAFEHNAIDREFDQIVHAWRSADSSANWYSMFVALRQNITTRVRFQLLEDLRGMPVAADLSPDQFGTVVAMLGHLSTLLGNAAVATQLLTESLSDQYCTRPLDWAVRTYNLGRALSISGNYETALRHFQEVLLYAESIDDKVLIGATYLNVGGALREQGRPAEALEAFAAALNVTHESGARLSAAIATHNVGRAYCDLNRHDEAVPLFVDAIARLLVIGARHYEAISRHCLGVAYAALGDVGLAIESLHQALRIREELGEVAAARETQLALIGFGAE